MAPLPPLPAFRCLCCCLRDGAECWHGMCTAAQDVLTSCRIPIYLPKPPAKKGKKKKKPKEGDEAARPPSPPRRTTSAKPVAEEPMMNRPEFAQVRDTSRGYAKMESSWIRPPDHHHCQSLNRLLHPLDPAPKITPFIAAPVGHCASRSAHLWHSGGCGSRGSCGWN